MLILSACERMRDGALAEDRKRLEAFLGVKDAGGKEALLKQKARCCG
jgi:hypothetical protein